MVFGAVLTDPFDSSTDQTICNLRQPNISSSAMAAAAAAAAVLTYPPMLSVSKKRYQLLFDGESTAE